MKEVRYWFGWFIVICITHLVEQLFFGIDELYEMRRIFGVYYGWFNNADYATVVLVGIGVSTVMLLLYATLTTGRARLIPFAVFGAVGVAEVHHIIKTVWHGAYFPGAVTAVPFIAIGALLLRAITREWQMKSRPHVLAAAA